MLTWSSDASHGWNKAVVRRNYNYLALQLRQSKDPFVCIIRRMTLFQIFSDITACDHSKEHKNSINQNCSFVINSWWVSHLWLIKTSNIHFYHRTSCLVCPTSPSLCYITGLSDIFGAPFNNCVFLRISLCSYTEFLFFAFVITTIRKCKHLLALSFSHVYCPWQLALESVVTGLAFIVCWQTIPFGVTTLQYKDNTEIWA